MANDDIINARGGLLPVQQPFGAFRKRVYQLGTNDTATVLYLGMPMDLDANGKAIPAVVGGGTNILGPLLGWFDSKKAGLPSAVTTLQQGASLPANTDAMVVIADDPEQLFMFQEDTGGTALTQSAVGNTFDFVYRSSSGNTTTGYSTAELDRSTIAATTAGQFTLVGLADHMNSDGTDNAFGNFAKVYVKINRHRFGPYSATQPI